MVINPLSPEGKSPDIREHLIALEKRVAELEKAMWPPQPFAFDLKTGKPMFLEDYKVNLETTPKPLPVPEPAYKEVLPNTYTYMPNKNMYEYIHPGGQTQFLSESQVPDEFRVQPNGRPLPVSESREGHLEAGGQGGAEEPQRSS